MSENFRLNEQKTAKLAALEIVVLALMRQQRDNPTFWDHIERVSSLFTDLRQLDSDGSASRLADLIQDELDQWRSIAGQDGSSPGDLKALMPGLDL